MTVERNALHIGVDIGGTKIALGLVTATGNILSQQNYPTQIEKGPEEMITELIAAINRFAANAGVSCDQIASIGIGVPGTVELASGNVVLAPNIFWRDVPLGARMKSGFPDIPIYIDQDTNTAVLGEFWQCEDPAVENLFFITISTGIGSGLILDKRLYRGQGNMAGEIGHIIVEKDGELCTCGSKGCLQAYAKGPAIAARVLRRIKQGEKSVLTAQIHDDQLTMIQVAEAASQGDRLALEVLLQAAEYVGVALANVVSLLNPDVIIIGGGVAQSGDLFIQKIQEVAKACCYPPARKSFRIELTKNWEKSPIIGAGMLHKTLQPHI
ncbi:glucokinase, ROK family [Candidatus Vecturithrix granuli]|uniref:Glucokinase, ROK family n=1 Tax=Vecturithrix granuli TaxID=1499967 RepID=A0A0S6W767_VECG1|nr:glucokinase, ROK family [Candidatus Vecturithrix granuli]